MSPTTSRPRWFAAWLLCAFTSTTTAYAQPPSASPAAAHAKKAQVAYNLADWATAIKEYRAAYAADQKAGYLFGLAQAQRQSGDCTAAIASYKAYKRGDVSANQATAAELLLTKCQAQIEQQKAREAVERANAAKADKKEAPPSGPPGETKKPSPQTAPPPAADEPTPWYKDAFGHVLFVAGTGVTVAGAIFLVGGNSDMNNTNGSYDDVHARQDSAKKKQVLGVGGLVVGGALLTGAILRYALVGDGKPSEPKHDKQAHVYGFAGPHGAELGVTGSF